MKSFADYKDAADLRQSIFEQFGQLIASGIIKLPDWTGLHKAEIQIPTRDGQTLRAIVYHPESTEPGPLFMFFHGGGWVFGTPEYGEGWAYLLVKELGFTVVSVGYRVAPEHVFPTAMHDGWDAVKWCAENASTVSADPSKGFILGGTSAGSTVATVAAHEAVDANLSPHVTGVVLASPYLCHHDALPEVYKKHDSSWEEHKDGLILDRRGMDWFNDKYKPDPKSPLASPLLWSSHKNQPPTYLQVMGMDALRDVSLIYEHILREDGVPTKLDVFAGIPHGGPDFLPTHSVVQQALGGFKAGVEWILRQQF
ncbi:uncharacterized protein K460DRAFT_289957 [Cucurbitaria berberidis CBS 394.84]|uniref:Alpha/beta hydrolase fold-3 domain-containing protein n=1 Tax=Cucurbitaria berberidis CBS 394.84 TaxID=1168544 RepID=A0A9P4GD23_9PLEO|nr:uncharacterized protein K460DRAFT_289957 [Cucurbitaria berberidis CBS 394.84]KAF1843269.1 hypothetical protein K460DRAFT_289957 [Cucurbitaria berberidis CBS 394.84]